jgi:hypothetical protein
LGDACGDPRIEASPGLESDCPPWRVDLWEVGFEKHWKNCLSGMMQIIHRHDVGLTFTHVYLCRSTKGLSFDPPTGFDVQTQGAVFVGGGAA